MRGSITIGMGGMKKQEYGPEKNARLNALMLERCT
jgi:hypothetical protein